MLQMRLLYAWFGRFIIAIALLIATTPLKAGTVFHRYDSLGHLTRVCNMLPTDTENTEYHLDSRDNRSSYTNTKTDIALPAGSGLTSPDGRFTLWMQGDGNLVLYQNSNSQALWWSGTNGTGANVAYFQGDGNLVVYKPGQAVWWSNTYFPCAHFVVQSDGNAVIYSADNQPVWQTGTGGR